MRKYLRLKRRYIARQTSLIFDSKLKIFCICYILVTIGLTSEKWLLTIPVLTILTIKRPRNLLLILIAVVISTLLFIKFNAEFNSYKGSLLEETNLFSASVIESENKEYNQDVIISSDLTKGLIIAKLAKYPTLSTGDYIKLRGKLTLPMNVGDFDYISYLHSNRIFYLLNNPEVIEIKNSDSLRDKILIELSATIDKSFSHLESSLLKGILYGDKSNFGDEFENRLRNSGLSHIVSVSGFNFVIIYSIVVGIFVSILNRRKAQLLSIFLILGFLILVGVSNIPALRATIMILLVVLASLRGRKPSTVDLILLSIVILLIDYPLNWTNISFLLSFASLAGLISLSSKFKSLFENLRIPEPMKEILSATFAVTCSTALISIGIFQSFSLVSVVSNLITLPLIPVVMGLGGAFLTTKLLNLEIISQVLSTSLNLLLSYLKVIINTMGGNWNEGLPTLPIGIFIMLLLLTFLLINDYKKFHKNHS